MNLYTGWDRRTTVATPQAIRDAIAGADRLQGDPFVIADRSGQWYLQTLRSTAGFIIEKREGDAESHYRAINLKTRRNADLAPELWSRLLSVGVKRDRHFLAEEVIDVFLAYTAWQADPAFLGWESIAV